MADPLIIKALQGKRAEVHGRISAYQSQIAQAKHDLAHINAAIRLFTDEEGQRVRYLVSHGFFKKGEIADIAVRHLEVDGELTTRELAERVMGERKLDVSDSTLRNSVVFKVVQALRHAAGANLFAWSRSARGYACGLPAKPSAFALPVSLPSPTDGREKPRTNQSIDKIAVAGRSVSLQARRHGPRSPSDRSARRGGAVLGSFDAGVRRNSRRGSCGCHRQSCKPLNDRCDLRETVLQ